MSGGPNLSIGLKGPQLLLRLLDRTQNFPESIFIRVAMEWLLDDEDVWSVELEYRLKKARAFDPTIGSHLNFPEAVFLRFVMEWLLGDEDVWSVELEYQLKRAITF
jgi:hypothetical protein